MFDDHLHRLVEAPEVVADDLLANASQLGAVHAGEANNVIPAEARLEISVRALDPQVRRSMEQRIRDRFRQIAADRGLPEGRSVELYRVLDTR